MCNQIWDCPGGLEEIGCSERQSCPGQFKCLDSIVCVTLESICDTIKDCPYRDDEYFCASKSQHTIFSYCPENCKCLLYTLACLNGNMTLPKVSLIKNIPYLAVFLSKSQTKSLHLLIEHFSSARFFSLSENSMLKICHSTKSAKSIHYIDASFNIVTDLSQNCFRHLKLLHFLNVSHNHISEIVKHVFQDLEDLEYLDISFNNIEILRSKAFHGLQKLIDLNLIGNPLLQISIDCFEGSKISNISTNNSKVCCLMINQCTNNASVFSTDNCKYTLLSPTVSSFMMTFSLTGMILSVLSIILSALNIGDIGGYNYRLTIINILFDDILSTKGLLILSAAHFYLNTSYFENEHIWRTNFFCFCCGFLVICHF